MGDSILDGLGMGLGFTLALTLLGFIREFLGSGTIFAGNLGEAEFGLSLGVLQNYSLSIFVLPAGGFLTLGLVMAAVNAISDYKAKKQKERYERIAQEIENAKLEMEKEKELFAEGESVENKATDNKVIDNKANDADNTNVKSIEDADDASSKSEVA